MGQLANNNTCYIIKHLFTEIDYFRIHFDIFSRHLNPIEMTAVEAKPIILLKFTAFPADDRVHEFTYSEQ